VTGARVASRLREHWRHFANEAGRRLDLRALHRNRHSRRQSARLNRDGRVAVAHGPNHAALYGNDLTVAAGKLRMAAQVAALSIDIAEHADPLLVVWSGKVDLRRKDFEALGFRRECKNTCNERNQTGKRMAERVHAKALQNAKGRKDDFAGGKTS